MHRLPRILRISLYHRVAVAFSRIRSIAVGVSRPLNRKTFTHRAYRPNYCVRHTPETILNASLDKNLFVSRPEQTGSWIRVGASPCPLPREHDKTVACIRRNNWHKSTIIIDCYVRTRWLRFNSPRYCRRRRWVSGRNCSYLLPAFSSPAPARPARTERVSPQRNFLFETDPKSRERRRKIGIIFGMRVCCGRRTVCIRRLVFIAVCNTRRFHGIWVVCLCFLHNGVIRRKKNRRV